MVSHCIHKPDFSSLCRVVICFHAEQMHDLYNGNNAMRWSFFQWTSNQTSDVHSSQTEERMNERKNNIQ